LRGATLPLIAELLTHARGDDTVSVQVNMCVVEEGDLTPEQQGEMLRLQIECFSGQVTAEEIEEDFNRPAVARVLAYHQGSLVGCAEVFKRQVEYAGHTVTVGGFSPCTREGFRGQGIGTRICKAAMNYLKDQGCDIAFLSVDTERETHPLYERLGFKMLPKPFIYANIRGELRQSDGGMIAPLCSQEVSECVLRGDIQFALIPEPGYW